MEQYLKKIAKIHTPFPEKFGIPRQSGLVDTEGVIIFEPEYRNSDCLRGIDEYSHLWLIWGFSETRDEKWRPMVRPPRLGGNQRVGVFATRSPFRPNHIGLSCVELIGVEKNQSDGTYLVVRGADILDGTPIYDIKPYLPYVDSIADAKGGFSDTKKAYELQVYISEEVENRIPEEQREIIVELLKQDPRPSYQSDPDRVYGMKYESIEIFFRVAENCLYVIDIKRDEDVH